jgi:hypothetical protein
MLILRDVFIWDRRVTSRYGTVTPDFAPKFQNVSKFKSLFSSPMLSSFEIGFLASFWRNKERVVEKET